MMDRADYLSGDPVIRGSGEVMSAPLDPALAALDAYCAREGVRPDHEVIARIRDRVEKSGRASPATGGRCWMRRWTRPAAQSIGTATRSGT